MEGLVGLFSRSSSTITGPTVGDAISLALAPPRPKVWARPNRCSVCGGKGFLDRIDVVDRIQYEHCTDYSHKWTVREQEAVKIG
ncbi:MAG: hypothetical protein NVSMB16_08240 [Acidimicrobiales bacterium]